MYSFFLVFIALKIICVLIYILINITSDYVIMISITVAAILKFARNIAILF